MGQQFKNVYFSDLPGEAHKRSLTLAFGEKDRALYDHVKALSSQEFREMLNHPSFASLQQAAEEKGLPVGSYCLHILRAKSCLTRESSQQYATQGQSDFDPSQVTFRGGQDEPLHNWYPYLEGYSPRFVEQILQTFAPKATRILDPFSGSGTTPLVAGRLGLETFYCELNPVLQYLTEVKSLASSLAETPRQSIIQEIQAISSNVRTLIEDCPADTQLDHAYAATFGNSRFFDDETYHLVLQARTYVDRLHCTNPVIAKFLSVAILSSLLPASKLIRRGDVRYKTEAEMVRPQIDFLTSVQNYLTLIGSDMKRLAPPIHTPLLLCEDAHDLDKLPNLEIDAVVTSPPYLNGTNYFRNTKIELWFLRCLRTTKDLTQFRGKAVMAGINDVTVGKVKHIDSQSLADIVLKLEATAYDARIPKMVGTYFADMRAIFRALRRHLTDQAKVIIDIGDSSYSNVHVPTHTLLTEVLASQGYELEQEITLRKRMSRGGFPLQQTLLVMRCRTSKPERVKEAAASPSLPWLPCWTQFKAEMPHQQGEYAKRNWGHPLHSLCSYQGKMKPALASYLVKTFVPVGGTMLDPFAGVGTIPFEAALQGKRSWALDISPTALYITTAKLGRPEACECEQIIEHLERYIQTEEVAEAELTGAQAIRFNGPLTEYFNPGTLREILLARRYFLFYQPDTPSEALVMASLLHILHGNRPYALSRRSHPITPFAPSGPSEYRPLLPRLRDKVARSLALFYPADFVPGTALFQDATAWWPQEVDQLDAIITSPPFFDSTRFYLANWMRLWFCGWEAADFRTQPLAFVDERQKVSFDIYQPILRQARQRLKPGGVLVFHLGQSRKCDMAQALARLATRWFQVADIFEENVGHCESHGIRDKGTVTAHQYLVLH